VTRTGRLAAALAVNAALVVGQVVAAGFAHSTALLADAGHNLADVAAIALSLLAVRWALRPRSETRSFGNVRGTILAALLNAATLVAVTMAIVAVSIYRLVNPVQVRGGVVAIVAACALVANVVAALFLNEGGRDVNIRSALLHMVGDAAASLCVLVAGLVIVVSGGGAWNRLDPLASLVVAGIIIYQAVDIVRESADVLLEATPSDVDLAALRATITAVQGVGELHDLHVWSLSSEVRALSAHLVLTGHPTLEEAQVVAGRVRAAVEVPFDLAHTTFELECERCVDEVGDPCGMDDLPVQVRSRRA
jgi:cobalt-zinc-cadmium efflux system protein